jgi:hypothetical protein
VSIAAKLEACKRLFDSPNAGEAAAARAAYARLSAKYGETAAPDKDDFSFEWGVHSSPEDIFMAEMAKAKAREGGQITPALHSFLFDQGYWIMPPLMRDGKYRLYGTDAEPLIECDASAILRFAHNLGFGRTMQ